MARPIRVEYPNAFYHVISRGNRRERVFACDNDYELFMEKLVEYAEAYEVVINSYCLMPNHFHLQLMTTHANLGKFMQSLLTSFTLIMNRKYDKSGHLFQGRYKAQLVESEQYKNKLSRYIHLNPVKLESSHALTFEEKKKCLRNYKWSSFRAYIGIENKPEWLNRSYVLSSWGKTAEEKVSKYRKYVEEGITTDNTDEVKCVMQGIIGSDSFKDKIIKNFLVRDSSDIDGREQPLLAQVNALSVDKLIDVVSCAINPEIPQNQQRKIKIYMAMKYCRKTTTLTEIAKRFELSISGLNMALHRFKEQLKKDRQWQKDIAEICKAVDEKCNNV